MTVVNIKWGREKKAIEFRDRILADIKLGELRQKCHEWTKVPLGGLTLIYGGATMKDDNAPLSCFGIKPNGVITMMGTKPSVSSAFFSVFSHVFLNLRMFALAVLFFPSLCSMRYERLVYEISFLTQNLENRYSHVNDTRRPRRVCAHCPDSNIASKDIGLGSRACAKIRASRSGLHSLKPRTCSVVRNFTPC